jgi:hypothetical protein
MEVGSRKFLLQKPHDAQILHDERIDWILVEIVDVLVELLQIMIVESDVQGAKEALVWILLFEVDDPLVLVVVEVVSLDSEREAFKSDIGGIGSVIVGVGEFVDVSGRAYEFHVFPP